MQKAKLLFEYSPWFILCCLAIGVLYAFVLYQKKGPWPKNINYFLAALRFTLASVLAFLLIGPFLRQINNTIERPTYIFAIDNSSSVQSIVDNNFINQILTQIGNIKSIIEDKSYSTEIRTFDGITSLEDGPISFDHTSTDLDGILKNIQSDYEGRGVAGVVLVSDGIYNQGLSPNFSPFKFPVFSVGIGDTIPKPDININAIFYNKIAYQGNKFPIVAEIVSNRLENRDVEVSVSQNGRVLTSKTLRLNGNQTLDEIELLVEANNKGMQHYQVRVTEIDGEFTTKNNQRDAYVDVIEGKEKILLIARAPHPDIKMMRNAILKNDNYDFVIHIPGVNEYKEDDYDLVIFHQIPDISNTAKQLMEGFLAKGVSTWFIVGSRTQLDYFNRINNVVEVTTRTFQTDNVTPSYNHDFHRFNYDDEYKGILNDFSPIVVPYGEVSLIGDAQIVMFQQVGSIVTKKPLLAIKNEGERKFAVMLGEGFWQWRLQEFASNQNQKAFDDLITKMVQYLSSKEDKRKFKVYPINNEVFDTENIVFETEVYNDIYERIYDHSIDLAITDENGEVSQYSYNTSQNNSNYTVTGLTQGVYKFQASSIIEGKREVSTGEFTVKTLQIEDLNLTANHQLLRTLSIQNGGKFYLTENINELSNDLANKEVKSTIYSSEAFLPIINLSWVFFLLLALASIEWFTRKYNGGY